MHAYLAKMRAVRAQARHEAKLEVQQIKDQVQAKLLVEATLEKIKTSARDGKMRCRVPKRKGEQIPPAVLDLAFDELETLGYRRKKVRGVRWD